MNPIPHPTEPGGLVCSFCGETSRIVDDPEDPARVVVWETHRHPCDGSSYTIIGRTDIPRAAPIYRQRSTSARKPWA